MQAPEPSAEHLWLKQLVGRWEYAHECDMGPDQPPVKSTGTQVMRMIGDLWMMGEMEGEVPGGKRSVSIMCLGYDPQKKSFVGSFITSMMTHFWPYQGNLDAPRRVLTLESEGPSFFGEGGMARYQDIIEVLGPDQHTLSSRVLGPDGNWTQFMRGTYRRIRD